MIKEILATLLIVFGLLAIGFLSGFMWYIQGIDYSISALFGVMVIFFIIIMIGLMKIDRKLKIKGETQDGV